ncbi:DUF5994 family protein [Amycolatopsis jejuensis]|uniref:DUF5994 family protein n=1 Tax=Amycolatopsis jejuensis TaxID=330084 RepID=UPI00068B7E22|nr:DUF5994 family protein [Amycolatopsis jejuensis]
MTVVRQRETSPEGKAGQPSAARLMVKPPGAERGHVDGGWWPRSLDLAAQLPELTAALAEAVGPLSRVTYHLDTWGLAARKVRVGERTVRLEGFRFTDPHTIMALGTDSRRVSLLVVPPETPGGMARAVLRSAASGDSTATAREILFGNGVPGPG